MTLRDQTIGSYLQALASTAAVPGGGSAAALAAALGTALLSMVAKLSARKATSIKDREMLDQLVPALDRIVVELTDLSQQDIEAYRGVIEARKSRASADLLEKAYERAAEVPLKTAEVAAESLAIASQISLRAWEMTASDLAVGTDLLEAGMGGALGNVAINLPELQGSAAKEIEARYLRLRAAMA